MSCTADILIPRRKNEPTHYMLKIDSFSLLSEARTTKIESDVFEASGHKWRLDLYPNGNDEEDKGSNHISLHVIICDTESLPKGWEIYVEVNFFIYDHKHHNYATFQDIIVNGNRTNFHEKRMKWGFDKMISLDSFKNCENGYLFNDSCVFGAEVFKVTKYAQKDRCLSMIKPPPKLKTFTWTIDNFSAIADGGLYSEIFKVCKVKWKLYIKKTVIGKSHIILPFVSIYLEMHDAALLPVGWRVYAKCKLLLKNQSNIPDIERELDHWFCDSGVSCGDPHFIPVFSLNDSTKGFLLNGSLIVEVEFSLVGLLNDFI